MKSIAKIEHEAEDLLRESNACRVPVALDPILTHLGLSAQSRALADASGVLVVQDGRGVIGYNEDHAPARQRFTIAHEIGHYRLHVPAGQNKLFIDQSVFRRDGKSAAGMDPQEIEANRFAAALLMPETLVRLEIERNELDLDDDDDVAMLARRFGVSAAAMTFRLDNLGLLNMGGPDQ
jgi:Zn-dependent peptidase ImmA (M78 family)